MTARRAIGIAALAAVVAAGGWVVRHSLRISTAGPAREQRSDPRVRFREIEVRGRSGGAKEWDLRADTIEEPRGGQATILKGVRKAILYQQGEPYLTLTAGEIRLDEGTRALAISGGLEAALGERVRFEAPRAAWDPQRRVLTCSGGVTLNLGRTTLTAPEMICDVGRRRFAWQTGVKVTAGRSVMRADRVTADIDDEVLTMAGDARGRFWVGEVEDILSGDKLDRALLDRVRAILRAAPVRRG
jgi:hypothetical protein